MWRGMVKNGLATALWGAVHSALADPAAEAWAARLVGPRVVDGLYRPFYLLQSAVLLVALVVYIRRQPGRELYRAPAPLAWVLRAGQLAALVYAGWAVYHVGLDFMTGWDGAAAWWHGAPPPPGPDGQGPAPAGGGAMLATGPFAYSRHPLNLALLVLLWLWPRMTTRLLAFNVVATAYLVLGSIHAEAHLVETYGAAYRRYQEDVPFFVPGPGPRLDGWVRSLTG